jgi:hypothetical protein
MWTSDPAICCQVDSLEAVILGSIKDGIEEIKFVKTHSKSPIFALIFGHLNPLFCIWM